MAETATIVREIDTAKFPGTAFLAELRRLDAEASQELGGPVIRHSERGVDTIVKNTWQRVDPLTHDLQTATDRIAAAVPVAQAIVNGRRMTKLAEIADRMARKRALHDAQADSFAARLDAIDRREPDAFARGEAFLKERETDLQDFEASLRQLSNLPLAGSQG
jgi:hypothetical protein